MTTPFFSNLGGSELETIHTANAFAIIDEVKQIDLFIYGSFDTSFAKNIAIDSKVNFISFPLFFRNKYISKIDKALKKIIDLEFSPFENLYWRIKLLTAYSNVYIITKSSQNYFLPIVKLYSQKNKIIVKFTTVFLRDLPENTKAYLAKIKMNLVTSDTQKIFFQKEIGLINTSTQEVLIFKESFGLKKTRNCYDKTLYDFGFLGRFSQEKRIEDAILLIENLKLKGYSKSLLISGHGEQGYFDKIMELISLKGLSSQIAIEFKAIPYDEIFNFFDRINCFLITSKYEGGPNVGLEVMAYGLPILSYPVGAMPDRLKNFPEFTAKNLTELIDKAIEVLNYDEELYVSKCKRLKNEYVKYYTNLQKSQYIRDFLFN